MVGPAAVSSGIDVSFKDTKVRLTWCGQRRWSFVASQLTHVIVRTMLIKNQIKDLPDDFNGWNPLCASRIGPHIEWFQTWHSKHGTGGYVCSVHFLILLVLHISWTIWVQSGLRLVEIHQQLCWTFPMRSCWHSMLREKGWCVCATWSACPYKDGWHKCSGLIPHCKLLERSHESSHAASGYELVTLRSLQLS